MKKIKNVFIIAILAVLSFSMVSCENENIDTPASELEVDNELNTTQVVNDDDLLQTRNGYYVSDLPLKAEIPYYQHLKQPSITGTSEYGSVQYTCGQTSYLVLRRAIDGSYAKPKKQNVINLHKWIWQKYYDYRKDPDHRASIAHIKDFATNVDNFTFRKVHKEARPLPGGSIEDINYGHPARTKFKKWLEGELRAGRPVVCPATWNLTADAMGHFFIVIGLDRDGNRCS